MINYNRVNWKDYPETDTPVSAENLNKMDSAIEAIDELLGDSDISSIEDGTVTGAISLIHGSLTGGFIYNSSTRELTIDLDNLQRS